MVMVLTPTMSGVHRLQLAAKSTTMAVACLAARSGEAMRYAPVKPRPIMMKNKLVQEYKNTYLVRALYRQTADNKQRSNLGCQPRAVLRFLPRRLHPPFLWNS